MIKELTVLKYIVLVHEDRESGGYWGECPELPGCFSQGETIEELMDHMKEAAELYERIKTDYAASTEGRTIDKYITRVKVKQGSN